MDTDKLFEYFTYKDGELISNITNKPYCNRDRDGYIRVRKNGKEYRAHRLIWELFYGEIPDGYVIDHIDGNVYNNSIENLRLATKLQNTANKSSLSSLPKGITRVGKRYRVRISYMNKTFSVGTYNTVEEAEKAYNELAFEIHGEYAKHISSSTPPTKIF